MEAKMRATPLKGIFGHSRIRKLLPLALALTILNASQCESMEEQWLKAIEHGDLELVRELADEHDLDPNLRDEEGVVLEIALENGHLDVAKELLRMGADPNLVNLNTLRKGPELLALNERIGISKFLEKHGLDPARGLRCPSKMKWDGEKCSPLEPEGGEEGDEGDEGDEDDEDRDHDENDKLGGKEEEEEAKNGKPKCQEGEELVLGNCLPKCLPGQKRVGDKCVAVEPKVKRVRKGRIAIVTQFTENLRVYADLTTKNHKKYADKHNYSYIKYEGKITNRFEYPYGRNMVFKEGLYWQKVEAVQRTLDEKIPGSNNPKYLWVLWIDADAFFTNQEIKLEDIIRKYAPQDSNVGLILPRDESGHPNIVINNGVFLLRNNEWGRNFIQSIVDMFEAYKECDTPEQDAFQDYVFQARARFSVCGWENRMRKVEDGHYELNKVREGVKLIPQRVMDSFERKKVDENSEARWQPCDFIAHVSGMPDEERRKVIEGILDKLDEVSCTSVLKSF